MSVGLDKAFDDVKEFNVAFEQRNPDLPSPQTMDEVVRRAKWVNDEVFELLEAKTLVDQADAYIDIAYFAIGGLVELGIKPEALWNIVHAANMAKLHDGKAVKSADGKVIKPEGWERPEPKLEAEVNRQVYEATLDYARKQ